MHSLRTSYKILIVSVAALCLSCASFWILHSTLIKKTAQFVELRDIQAREVYAQDNGARALEVLSKTATVRAALNEYFVSYEDPLELLSMVDGQLPTLAGVSAGVVEGGITKETLSEKSEKGNKVENGQSYVRIAVNVKGDWQNMYRYLLLLEHMPYATTIDKVVLTKSGTGGDFEWEGDVFLAAATSN